MNKKLKLKKFQRQVAKTEHALDNYRAAQNDIQDENARLARQIKEVKSINLWGWLKLIARVKVW
jgi:hypothetical protein